MKFSTAFVATAISASSTSAFTANLQKRNASTKLMAFDPSSFLDGATKFFASALGGDNDSGTTMVANKADATSLINEATRLSKDFGPASPEARLAWEAVEEVNASDNSAATMGSLDTECEIEQVSEDCLEYGQALEDLQELIAANAVPNDSTFAKELASTVSPVKLSKPDAVVAPNSAALDAALKEARAVTASNGLSSPEAAVAWETVEEIAAAGNSNALGGSISADECFVEAAKEACDALEELHKIVGDFE